MTDRTLDASASKYGLADIKITNRGLTTTIIIEAIQKYAGKQVDHLGPILIHQEMNGEGVNNCYKVSLYLWPSNPSLTLLYPLF